MQTETDGIWTSFHATLAQEGGSGPNPVFSGASPSAPPANPAPGTQAPPPGGGAPQSPFGGILMPVIFVVMMLFIFQIFASRRQDKKRRELLNAVKKYDKVITLGGIIGTVVELRDDEVVLKVDEHSSTKIRFTRSAIQQVIRPPGENQASKSDDEEKVESGAKSESVSAKR
jgi:preprotein translocase subunit YajC